jgi:hypothetical protein
MCEEHRMITRGPRWRRPRSWSKSGLLHCSIQTLLFTLVAFPVAAEAGEGDARGFWLGLSPLAGAYHLNYGYDAPGTSERVEHTQWLNAWALDVGWRFSPGSALGIGWIRSQSYEYGEEYEYSQLILRLDWNPTRAWWFLSFSGGIGDAQTPFMETPSGEPFVTSGGAFVAVLGAGGDYAVTSWLTLRGRAEYLLGRQVLPSDVSDEIDVNGWSLGAYAVWTP